MKKVSLPIQILIGIVASLLFTIFHISQVWDASTTLFYIKPIGIAFINSLKIVSVPLVVTSILVGINNIKNTAKIYAIGLKALFFYTSTTFLAVSFGLLVGNLMKLGKLFTEDTKRAFTSGYEAYKVALQTINHTEAPASFVSDNLLKAFSDNGNLLFIVLFAIVFGIALLGIRSERRKAVVLFFEGINDAFVEITKFIMRLAPFGIFALITSVLIEQSQGNLANVGEFLVVMAWYSATVLFCLGFMVFVVYPFLVTLFSKVGWGEFLKAMQPAQLVAFSTSSSSATLPITMKCVERLGVPEEISSFVLPIGATVNMDGTAMYQAIAIMFIAQTYGVELSIMQQIMIGVYLTTYSVGIAGLPGVSLGVTSMLLLWLNIPPEGIALIILPDRILDMCRTVTNITGDASVAVIIAGLEKKR